MSAMTWAKRVAPLLSLLIMLRVPTSQAVIDGVEHDQLELNHEDHMNATFSNHSMETLLHCDDSNRNDANCQRRADRMYCVRLGGSSSNFHEASMKLDDDNYFYKFGDVSICRFPPGVRGTSKHDGSAPRHGCQGQGDGKTWMQWYWKGETTIDLSSNLTKTWGSHAEINGFAGRRCDEIVAGWWWNKCDGPGCYSGSFHLARGRRYNAMYLQLGEGNGPYDPDNAKGHPFESNLILKNKFVTLSLSDTDEEIGRKGKHRGPGGSEDILNCKARRYQKLDSKEWSTKQVEIIPSPRELPERCHDGRCRAGRGDPQTPDPDSCSMELKLCSIAELNHCSNY